MSLKKRILQDLKRDGKIDTASLIQKYHCIYSKRTIRQALADLREEGLIKRYVSLRDARSGVYILNEPVQMES